MADELLDAKRDPDIDEGYQEAGLGELEDSGRLPGGNDFNKQSAGIASDSPWQTQQFGARGRRAEQFDKSIQALYSGLKMEGLPEPHVLELWSRMLEQTFRNFYAHSIPPAWQARPFSGDWLDEMNLFTVSIAPLADVLLIDIEVPEGQRAEICGFGHAFCSALGASELRWFFIGPDEKPVPLYGGYTPGAPPTGGFRGPIGSFEAPSATFCASIIHIQGPARFQVRVGNDSAVNTHDVRARVQGWKYTTRAEVGDEAQSTIVD